MKEQNKITNNLRLSILKLFPSFHIRDGMTDDTRLIFGSTCSPVHLFQLPTGFRPNGVLPALKKVIVQSMNQAVLLYRPSTNLNNMGEGNLLPW